MVAKARRLIVCSECGGEKPNTASEDYSSNKIDAVVSLLNDEISPGLYCWQRNMLDMTVSAMAL